MLKGIANYIIRRESYRLYRKSVKGTSFSKVAGVIVKTAYLMFCAIYGSSLQSLKP